MKKHFLSVIALSLGAIVQAQTTPNRVLDKNNMREGENVEYCVTHKKMAEFLSNPQNAAQYQLEQEQLRQLIENAEKSKPTGSGTEKAVEYTIPVVFHVLHNGGDENISRDQIISALNILNRDYAMLNADTISIQSNFQALRERADIKFALATKAPNGACFSGITRTSSPMSYQGDNGNAQVNAIVAGNDVYQGQWPGNKYLNVFICGDIGGAAGYTMLPGSWSATSMTNGIWILHDYLGNMGTSSEFSSRALTHEVGHWLNLDHVWGGNNNPGSAGCNGTDNVQDTPHTQGSQSCNLNANTCSTDNAYWGFDQIDNVENYMDYSYCSKMFTIGQVARMRAAIVVSNTGRANVISNSNLTAVGANSAPTLCQAKFSTPKIQVCTGETVNFTDESFNLVNGWTWTFPSGTPASATTQNASTVWNTPGTYTVTLLATDGSSSDDYTMQVTVLPNDITLPYYESFESLNNFTGSTRWFVESPGNSTAWDVTNTAGNTGTKSAKLANFGQTAGALDNLTSGKIDLSGITSATGATLTFRYAYRKRTSADLDALKVYCSSDCAENWSVRKSLTATTMTQGATAASAWTPTAADWVTVHVTNINSTYWVEDFRFRFEFKSDGGNNMYIDDINLYAGEPSETIVVGLEELSTVNGAMLYPNPADNEVNLKFNSVSAQNMNVVITDLTGKIVQSHSINALQGENLIFMSTDTLASGAYFVKLTDGTASTTLPFVVK